MPSFVATVAAIVSRISVLKPVRQHKVNRRVMPAEGGGLVGIGIFQQQEAIAAGIWLQGDFPVADHGRLSAVKITNFAAIREGSADINR